MIQPSRSFSSDEDCEFASIIVERSPGYREFVAPISRAISISAMVAAPSCEDAGLGYFDMFSDLSLKVGTEVFFTQKINNFLVKLDVVIAKAGMARKDRSQINELLQG